MKAVIADDEIRVCRLIEKLINWEDLDIKIISQVNNGIKALNVIISEEPDIVITDIRMPGLDGLTLIKRVREAGIKTSFIIISEHKKFEHAQSAVKYDFLITLMYNHHKYSSMSLYQINDKYQFEFIEGCFQIAFYLEYIFLNTTVLVLYRGYHQ